MFTIYTVLYILRTKTAVHSPKKPNTKSLPKQPPQKTKIHQNPLISYGVCTIAVMISVHTQRLVDQHKPAIAEKLRELERLLLVFGRSLAQEARPAVVFDPITESGPNGDLRLLRYKELDAGASREAAVTAYTQLDYRMEDRVNRSIRCYGALGVPMRVINDAKVINRAKSEFKATLRAIAGKRVRVTVKDKHGADTVTVKELSNAILRQLQRSSLNLLAAYREVRILEETPLSIHFMQTLTRSVPRKTAQALLDQLDGRTDALAMSDRKRLDALPRRDEYLVSPKARYPRMRAHVFGRKLDADGKAVRQIVFAEVPILYPIRKRVRPPDLIKPAIRGKKTRAHPTSFIEPEEFVKTLHYRRMQQGHRHYAHGPNSQKKTR